MSNQDSHFLKNHFILFWPRLHKEKRIKTISENTLSVSSFTLRVYLGRIRRMTLCNMNLGAIPLYRNMDYFDFLPHSMSNDQLLTLMSMFPL